MGFWTSLGKTLLRTGISVVVPVISEQAAREQGKARGGIGKQIGIGIGTQVLDGLAQKAKEKLGG